MRIFYAILIILTLWASLYLPGLGGTELRGEEGRRILPAREMERRGNYILPYSEGRPYHRKPPGINWAVAASFKVFGVENEWTARAPSVVALLALALAGLWAGNRIGGLRIGLPLAVTLLINFSMLEKARLIEIEAVYVSLVGIGILAWAVAWLEDRRKLGLWLGTVVPFALAHLTKGPVFLLFFYPMVILVLWRTGKMKRFLHPAHVMTFLLALAPMLIWGYLVKQQVAQLPVAPMLDEEGRILIARSPGEVWWQQIAGRLTFADINWADWLKLPLRMLMMFLPWPLLAWWALRQKSDSFAGVPNTSPDRNQRIEILRQALGWGSLAGMIFFVLLPTTRARFVMPALAPVCLWAVLTLVPRLSATRLSLWWERLMIALFALVTIAAVSLPYVLKSSSPHFVAGISLVAAFFLFRLLRYIQWLPQPLRFFFCMAPLFMLLSLILVTTILPEGRRHENVRPPAMAINALATNPGSIAAHDPGAQPFLFYLGKRCVEVNKIFDFPQDTAYLLVSPKDWEQTEWRNRLMSHGFTKTLTTVRDQRTERGKEFLLIGRENSPEKSAQP